MLLYEVGLFFFINSHMLKLLWFTWQVSLFALTFWSFHFASICAFALLVYVGYILYAFPSLFRLHRLNGLLLVFILLWAVSTYIFNVGFAFMNWKLGKVKILQGQEDLISFFMKNLLVAKIETYFFLLFK